MLPTGLPRLALAAMGVAVTGCGGNWAIDLPLLLDDRIVLDAPLNPDSAEQAIVVHPVNEGTWLEGTVVTIHRGRETEAGTYWSLVGVTREVVRCGGDGFVQCLVLPAVLETGATYRVEVSAEKHAPAWGVTRAVGDFSVDSARLSDRQGARVLSASWTRSVAAHRYMVSLRRYQNPDEVRPPEGWYLAVEGTSVTTTVPESAVEKAVKPLILDVVAVDEHLYSYITTGNDGEIFPVMPIQNVEGGFGYVGSLRFRSRPVTVVR